MGNFTQCPMNLLKHTSRQMCNINYGKDKQKKEKYEEWGKLGFAGLILKAMTGAGKKSKKEKSKKDKDKLIEKDYW